MWRVKVCAVCWCCFWERVCRHAENKDTKKEERKGTEGTETKKDMEEGRLAGVRAHEVTHVHLVSPLHKKTQENGGEREEKTHRDVRGVWHVYLQACTSRAHINSESRGAEVLWEKEGKDGMKKIRMVGVRTQDEDKNGNINAVSRQRPCGRGRGVSEQNENEGVCCGWVCFV